MKLAHSTHQHNIFHFWRIQLINSILSISLACCGAATNALFLF
jgi:hypothetical protein